MPKKRRHTVSKKKRKEKEFSKRPLPEFGVDQLLQVNDGVMDIDFVDLPLGGWVGRVAKVHRLPEGPKYDVVWTEETLQLANPIYKRLAEMEMLTHNQYDGLEENEVHPYEGGPIILTDPGDLTRYTDRPLSDDDFDDRLRKIFGLGAMDSIESHDSISLKQFWRHLTMHLDFPFKAKYLKETREGTESLPFICEELIDPNDFYDEMHGLICFGKDSDRVERKYPFRDLLVENLPEDQKQMIEDYQEWMYY